MKLVELLLEIFGWLQIVIGMTLGAGIIAMIIYLKWSNDTGKVVAIIVASIGFVSGCILATLIWKKHGTIEWLSRIRRIS
jgi:phosphotransferase system  glucose/maltose/N-acetylglucosamine-specific IIC component